MITVRYENDDGEEIALTFPSVMQVCSECQGEGYVLCEGMRGHAYSAEEFAESFDEEEAREYFTRGGMYDQVCPVCKGKNVIAEIDEETLTAVQKLEYEEFCQYEERRLQSEAEDRATMRAEYGYRE